MYNIIFDTNKHNVNMYELKSNWPGGWKKERGLLSPERWVEEKKYNTSKVELKRRKMFDSAATMFKIPAYSHYQSLNRGFTFITWYLFAYQVKTDFVRNKTCLYSVYNRISRTCSACYFQVILPILGSFFYSRNLLFFIILAHVVLHHHSF